jgi:acetyl/propionyl-CoA carboxylase alpha subunit/acetyl-CoA carboxylase carboxyltransferase component
MTESFQCIAIVNRGEAAMRLIHAVREFNCENGLDLKTVALFTEPDRQAMFVREADRAVSLGAATWVNDEGQRKNSYLNYEAIENALLKSAADAVWVGWGFVAEHPGFADLCERKLGLTFIGPDGDCMRRLGDKISAKKIAEEAGVPVAPWSGGPVRDLDEAHQQADRIGLPLMIKATAGGGGRGIRSVRTTEELDEAFERATSEALTGFGDSTVFMERMVGGARHIEVQIIADDYGTVWPVGVRDCSVQRRNQKLIEESSSPALTEEQENFIKSAAARLCRSAGYRNAGTVEFLYEMETESFAFMEVNARLQVEHPVTEVSTGLDLVKMQLHLARGGRLTGQPPAARGTAIEVRLNAEDPARDFAPAPGRVEMLRFPTGAGIRIDTGIEQGDHIPGEFDSMIAKIIAHGRDRGEALSRLRRALLELAVVIQGGTTNRAFLLELLNLPPVIEGNADVGWLDRDPPSQWLHHYSGAEIALALAAIHEYEEELDTERQLFLASASRGRPNLRTNIGCSVELRHGGNLYRLNVYRLGGDRFRVYMNGRSLPLKVEVLNRFERRISCVQRVYRTLTMHSGFDFLIEVDGKPHRVSRDDGGTVRSPAPAIVVGIKVKPGDEIKKGDTLAILEAMKLEMRVTSAFSGTVRSVEVAQNEQVDAGRPLLRLMPSTRADEVKRADLLTFETLTCVQQQESSRSARERCRELFDELQNLVLGYDVHSLASTQIIEKLGSLCGELPGDFEEMRQQEELLLTRFADACALSRRLPAAEPDRRGLPAVTARSHQESLFTYMRALDSKGEGLSRTFIRDLKRALRHYGIEDLDPSQALEEALLWLMKSHSRVDHQLPAVVFILGRRLNEIDSLINRSESEFRSLLERLISVSQGRYHAVADLAREIRYKYFDKPLRDAARDAAYQQADQALDALTRAAPDADNEQHMQSLVRCPQPLMTVLSRRFVAGDEAMREVVIECLTRRYYRIRELENIRILQIRGHPFFSAEYPHDDGRMSLITTHTSYEDLTHTGKLLLPLLDEIPDEHDTLVDFYIHRQGSENSEEDTLTHVRQAIDAIPFSRRIRRIVTSVRIPGAGLGITGQRFFTFRPSDQGYWEEEIYRGLHPMMAKRLHLYRFQHFRLERLPSVEDLYLFHAVARENPKDERLFAVAEVRDMSAFRDDAGKLTGLPHLEHMLQEALAGIREFQSHRQLRKRLYWNRIVLYVRPPMKFSSADRNVIVRKLFPATVDLGLEKVVVRARMARRQGDELRDTIMVISNPAGRGPRVELLNPEEEHRVQPLSPYQQKVLKMRQRGLAYPYEIVRLMTPGEDEQSVFPHGRFTEFDFSGDGMFAPVERSHGLNSSNIIAGLITSYPEAHPEGMRRVIILSDPGRGMCPLAEPECSRIIAALDMAERLNVPLEWFAISAGAKIAMDSGTENLDWTAAVLRRIIEFTQAGREINVIVHGVNVGAQSYWNAEATMLMHTRGVLIMTPQGAMVLTGKQALDYSGGVSAEDNFGIGGYDRIMGPNGQAQYWAADIDDACRILFRHYDHSYKAAGEHVPRRTETRDPADRDISGFPYSSAVSGDFRTIGEVFSRRHNPGRKKSFEIRPVMRAVVDRDHEPLERWSTMRDAEMAVVWDAHLGGYPVCLIGIESQAVARAGFIPADGPDQWSAGTLFPLSSRKVARAINSTSGNRPLVVLANLSGFDGSPESMRRWQLEHGAEIGRAVVNFEGPIVFCVVSRYHGGAFVVFSKSLNENMEVAALEGSYASVIGGAPAAGVVFSREVRQETIADPRIRKLKKALKNQSGSERAKLLADYDQMFKSVTAEKRGELAEKFDLIHSVQRAQEVGSIDYVIPPANLRPYLIKAVERGIERELKKHRLEEASPPDEPCPQTEAALSHSTPE